MAAKELMTWVPRRKRWTKFYKGKMWAVSCKQLKVPANKEDSRSAANKWWETKQNEIDAKSRKPNQDKYEDVIRTRERMAAWFKQYLREDPVYQKGLDEHLAHIQRLRHILETEDEPPPLTHHDDPFAAVTQGGRQVWYDRLRNMDFGKEATDNITSQTVREFLAIVHEIPALDEIKGAIRPSVPRKCVVHPLSHRHVTEPKRTSPGCLSGRVARVVY